MPHGLLLEYLSPQPIANLLHAWQSRSVLLSRLEDQFYQRTVIEKAQIRVIFNWIAESGFGDSGQEAQKDWITNATRLAIQNVLTELEDHDPDLAARISSALKDVF